VPIKKRVELKYGIILLFVWSGRPNAQAIRKVKNFCETRTCLILSVDFSVNNLRGGSAAFLELYFRKKFCTGNGMQNSVLAVVIRFSRDGGGTLCARTYSKVIKLDLPFLPLQHPQTEPKTGAQFFSGRLMKSANCLSER
jgi:hypothetical protein